MAASQDFNGVDEILYYEHGSAIVSGYPLWISCWFQANTPGGADIIMAFGNTVDNNGIKFQYLSNEDINYTADADGTDPDIVIVTTASENVWYHLFAISRTATDHEGYLNGVSVGTSANDAPYADYGTLERLVIAAEGDLTGFGGGLISHAKFGNAAVTDAEILESFYDVNFLVPGLIAHYPLWENASAVTDFKDISGNGFHMATGTIPDTSTIGPPIYFHSLN